MVKLFKNFFAIANVWIKYFLILLLAIVFEFFYPEYISSSFIIFIFLVPLLSLIYILIGAFLIKASLEIQPKIIIKNEVIILNVLFFNRSFLSFPRLEARYTIAQKIGLQNKYKVINFSLIAKKKYKCEEKIICNHIGRYKCKIEFIKISDLFGFFKLKIKSKTTIEFLSLPRKIFIPEFNNNLFSDIESNIIRKTNTNTSNIFATRNYITGDELKLVHWKNSAKLDEIVVKEFEEKRDALSLILLDLKKYYDGEKNYIAMDGIIEIAISIIDKLISNKIKMDIVWYEEDSKDIKLKNLLSELECNNFFQTISCLESYKSNISLEDILNTEIIYNENYTALFIITPSINFNLINNFNNLTTDIQIIILYLKLDISQEEFNYHIGPENIIFICIENTSI